MENRQYFAGIDMGGYDGRTVIVCVMDDQGYVVYTEVQPIELHTSILKTITDKYLPLTILAEDNRKNKTPLISDNTK